MRLFLLVGLLSLPVAVQAEQCREFTRTIMIGGKAQEGVGTACRQPDGSWRTVSQGREEEIAWNPPVNDRIVYVERETPIYIERPRPVSVFSLSLGNGRGYCERPRWRRHGHGWGHDRGRGHGGGHHRGRW